MIIAIKCLLMTYSLFIEECIAEPSSEKVCLEGHNTETHNGALSKKWGSLEHSALNELSIASPSLWGSEIYVEEEAEILYEPQVVDYSRKSISQKQQGGCICELRDFDSMHQTCTSPSQTTFQFREQKGPQLPPLTKTLVLIDTIWERKHTFSSMDWHCVC